ncbi:MAG: hypothetical protein AAFY88_13895 [Acidobacteriota bacterium]
MHDFFNFATGDRLLDADADLCNKWHSRFLNGGDFNGGTELRFFAPVLPDGFWSLTGRVFDEAGNLVQTIPLASDRHTLGLKVFFLNLDIPFGTIEWTFDNGVKGHVGIAMEALGRFSVGYEAACRD